MRRIPILTLGAALATAGFALAAQAAPAKAPAADPTVAPPGWAAPKNAFGQPDISGYWSNATMTPLMRNAKLTDKLVVAPNEARELEKAFSDALAAADAPTDQKKGPGAVTDPNSAEAKLVKIRPDFAAAGGDVGGYNTFWIARFQLMCLLVSPTTRIGTMVKTDNMSVDHFFLCGAATRRK